VPWDKCEKLCTNVKAFVVDECKNRGINFFLISCRVTQTYDAGACVYFYFGFRFKPNEDPVQTYEEIEIKTRNKILSLGELSIELLMELSNSLISQVDQFLITMESEKLILNGSSKVFQTSASICSSRPRSS
jgi:hypothetical protein